jgi:hypothetical protein
MIAPRFKLGDKVAAIALPDAYLHPRPRIEGLTVKKITLITHPQGSEAHRLAPYYRILAESEYQVREFKQVEGAERFFEHDRSPDTMLDAIALSSPSGRMSKRARKAAEKRLHTALWPDGFPAPTCPQPSKQERLMRQAKELRDLADRGMKPRAYRRKAEQLEQQAQREERAS